VNPIIQLIIAQLPAIAALIREAKAKSDPSAPPVGNEEVLAGFEELFGESYARDEVLKAALRAELGLAG
jgi:hypothetical protein